MGLNFKTDRNTVWLAINEELEIEVVDNKYEPSKGEAIFYCNIIDPKEGLKLIDKATKVKWDRGQRFEKTDFYKLQVDKINRTIIDWKGVLDDNGEPIDCTDEAKETIYRFNRHYIEALLTKLDDIEKGKQKEKEDEEKN